MDNKYKIKIKQDFGRCGYYNPKTRKNEKLGFVLTKDGMNCIPGAGWFTSIADVMLGVKVHLKTGDTQEFHTEYKKLKKLQQN